MAHHDANGCRAMAAWPGRLGRAALCGGKLSLSLGMDRLANPGKVAICTHSGKLANDQRAEPFSLVDIRRSNSRRKHS